MTRLTAEEQAERFVREVMDEVGIQVPTTLLERNTVQLVLAERVQRNFGLTELDAVLVVGKVYGGRFPQ